MLIFTSPDMKEWTLQSKFGQGLGAQDGVWECPDLFELPVVGTDKKNGYFCATLTPAASTGAVRRNTSLANLTEKPSSPTLIPPVKCQPNGSITVKTTMQPLASATHQPDGVQ